MEIQDTNLQLRKAGAENRQKKVPQMFLQPHTGEKLLLQLFLKVILHCQRVPGNTELQLDTDFSLLVAQSCYTRAVKDHHHL